MHLMFIAIYMEKQTKYSRWHKYYNTLDLKILSFKNPPQPIAIFNNYSYLGSIVAHKQIPAAPIMIIKRNSHCLIVSAKYRYK